MATDSADVLVNGDPNLVGQGTGRVFVAVAPGLLTGGLAGLAEGGVAEAGAANPAPRNHPSWPWREKHPQVWPREKHRSPSVRSTRH